MPIVDPVQGYRLEAETFTGLTQPGGFRLADVPLASGGRAAKLGPGRAGEISVDPVGAGVPTGLYRVRVVYVDETDGQSQATLSLNGNALGAWNFDGIAGRQLDPTGRTGTGQQSGNWREIVFAAPVTIDALSRLTIAATQDGAEVARIDHIELIPVPQQPPSTIALTPAVVTENTAGAIIGQLSATDPDPGDTAVFTTTDARFQIVGNELRLRPGVTLDAEQAGTVDVAVTATDSFGLATTRTLTITVANVNEAPSFIAGPTAIVMREGGLIVADYGATDPDLGAALTFSIAGGDDAARFTIDGNGQLAFIAAPSAATPTDADGNGIYRVTVGVSDGELTDLREVEVRVAPATIRIDFRPAASADVAGWLADTGKAFSPARGYGWITEASLLDATPGTIAAGVAGNPGATTDRKTAGLDRVLATAVSFEPPDRAAFAWEHALTNGWYRVTAAIGDATGPNTLRHVINAEGVALAAPWTPNAIFRSSVVTGLVEVKDGRLTLDSIGGDGTRIQSVEIQAIADLTPLDANPAPADYAKLLAPVALGSGAATVALAQAQGVDPASSFAVDLAIVRSGEGVQTASLGPTTVRLYETLTGIDVAGEANTSGGGDVIVFTPDAPLRENTGYTLSIIGVTDTGGFPVLPLTASFATGSAEVEPIAPFAFTAVSTAASPGGYTTLVISPDGTMLYAAGIDGSVTRWSIDAATGALSNEQRLDQPALAGRPMIGLVFDPTDPDVLWATSNGPFAGSQSVDFGSKLVRITLGDGPGFNAVVEDYLIGLPRSARDHLSNSIAFHDDGTGQQKLYLTQGSNSAMGAPDNAWDNRPERLLSAAVLEIDTSRDVSGGPINVQTQDPNVVLPNGAGAQLGWYDPFAPDAPVKLYATGIRNAYDLVWHSNGGLYIATNGSAAGGNVPDDPSTPINEALFGVGTQNDYLFNVREGFYYGHPNPVRDEYILNGGNPTAGADPYQVGEYPVGVTPPSDYGGIAYDFSRNRSPNGAIEYRGNGFDGSLAGRLLITEYSGGNDILVLELDASGAVVGTTRLADAFGQALLFNDPLDLVEHGPSGRIYVASLGDGSITLLDPTDPIALPGSRPFRIEAENLPGIGATGGWTASNFAAASGGQVAAPPAAGGTLTLPLETLTPGFYQVRVVYVDETDGVASARVAIGGAEAGTWQFDGIAGQAREPDTASGPGNEVGNFRSILLPNVIEIGAGETLEITVTPDAGEPGRIDFLELLQVADPVW